MVLTKEQFTQLRNQGLTTEQIAKFEKRRAVEQPSPQRQALTAAARTALGITIPSLGVEQLSAAGAGRPSLTAPGAYPFARGAVKYGSSLLGGLPEEIVAAIGKRAGVGGARLEPPATGVEKAADIAGTIAGYTKGPLAVGTKVARKLIPTATRLIPQMGRGAIGLGTAEALRTRKLKPTIAGAKLGAALPVAGAVGGGAIRGTGRLIRGIGGVYPATVRLARKVGYKRIIDPAKRLPGYFSETLVPRVKNSVNKLLNTYSYGTKRFLEKLGISQPSINSLRTKGYVKLNNLSRRYKGSVDPIVLRARQGIDFTVNNAKQRYGILFDKKVPRQADININRTFHYLRNELEKGGYIDHLGNPTATMDEATTLGKIMKIFQNMRTNLQPSGVPGRTISAGIDKMAYVRYRNMIEAAEGSVPTYNRYVYGAAKRLRADAAAKYPFLKTANRIYANAMDLKDNYLSGIKENLFSRKTWTGDQERFIRTLDSMLPKQYKFFRDLSDLRSINEISGALSKNFSDASIAKSLQEFGNYKSPNIVEQNRIKDLYNSFVDKSIPDDALAHYLAKDLFQETLPPGFMGISGITRKAAETGVRGYLKGREFLRPVVEPAARYLRKTLPY